MFMPIAKTSSKTLWLCAVLICYGFKNAHATSITNADTAVNLNLGGSWVGGTPAGSADVAVWDHTVQVNTTKALGANLAWAGIQVLDPATLVTISAGNNLTNGASGIDLSLATNSLTLACPLVLGANQTWNVTNGQTLTVSGQLLASPATSLILNGTGTNNFSNAANGTYAGGVTLNSGTLIIGGANGNANSAVGTGIITNNGGTLLTAGKIVGNVLVFNNTSIVDAGLGSFTVDGAWQGSGTVIVTNMTSSSTVTAGGNGNGGGNFTAFTGSIILAGVNRDASPTAGNFRFNNGGANNNVGNAAMALDLGQGSVHFTEKNSGAIASFGALFGGPNTQLAAVANYAVGGLNLANDTFSGASVGATSTFTKNGTGIFTWNNTSANTYSGLTTVNTGVLQIGDGVTSGAGSLGSGAIVINASGTLTYNKPDDFSVANNISGAGTLIKTNSSTLTYTGTDSSSGTAIISKGTLALGASALMSSAISVVSGATLDLSQDPTFTLNQNLSGSGVVTGAVVAVGGNIIPGGSGVAGTLSFSNSVTESGTVNNQLEITGTGGPNDLINIAGDLNASGTNTFTLSHLGGGAIPNGTYTLITYGGNFNGGLSNFVVIAAGNVGVLANPANQITVTISPAVRGATNLTWKGDGAANTWDIGTSNWVSAATSFAFQTGDSVRFDGVGAANPTVNLNVSVLPAAVVVSNAATYTITGSGSIGGATGLAKTNSGILNLQTTNSYTGPTVVGGGTLAVSYLANGTLSSSIGAASSDPTNLVFYSSTLSYTGPTASTDHGATLNGSGVTLDVPGGTTLTLNGTLTGLGALTLVDTGTLTLDNPNTYTGGTVLSNGVLALGSNAANNNGAGGSGVGATNKTVTFYGGTLQLYGVGLSPGNNYNTFYNPLVVPAGQSGTLIMFPRGQVNAGNGAGLNSSLSGGGTLNLVVNYVRDALSGDWSAFTGLIDVTAKNISGDEMRINNNFGFANATIFLNDGVIMDSALTVGATINIGELGGTSGAIVGPGSASQPNPTWVVGWKNTTNTFAGTIANDGTASSIVKVGTGTWILTGANTFAGSTTVSNGVLALGDGVTDGSIANSANINVLAVMDVTGRSDKTLALGSSQTLQGSGTVRGIVDASSGGTVAPGGGVAGGVGTLTVTNSVTLGGTAWIKLNRGASPNSDKLSAPSIILGGALVVTNIGAALHVGDSFTLFNGTLSGTFNGNVTLPGGYTWNTNSLETSGTISVTAVASGPIIGSVDYSQLSSGTLTFNATGGTPGGSFSVLTSTNLTLPLASWTTAATGNYDGSGNLTGFSVTVNPALPQSFFILAQ